MVFKKQQILEYNLSTEVVQEQAHQKSFSTTQNNWVDKNKINKIWLPVDDIALKGGVTKKQIFNLFSDSRYSDFLSKHSRFEKFPAKDGKKREH